LISKKIEFYISPCLNATVRVQHMHQDHYLTIPVSAHNSQTLAWQIYIGLGYTVSDTKKWPLRARLSFDFGGQGFWIRKESRVEKCENAISEMSRVM
jgi:hypothetical protein